VVISDITVLRCGSSQTHLGTSMLSGGGHIIRALIRYHEKRTGQPERTFPVHPVCSDRQAALRFRDRTKTPAIPDSSSSAVAGIGTGATVTELVPCGLFGS
jgi:hypothetical protein